MNSEDQASKRRTFTDIAYQFVIGTTYGLVLIMLPAFFISLSTLEWQRRAEVQKLSATFVETPLTCR